MWQVVLSIYLVVSIFPCMFVWKSLALAKQTDCYIRSGIMLCENMPPD